MSVLCSMYCIVYYVSRQALHGLEEQTVQWPEPVATVRRVHL